MVATWRWTWSHSHEPLALVSRRFSLHLWNASQILTSVFRVALQYRCQYLNSNILSRTYWIGPSPKGCAHISAYVEQPLGTLSFWNNLLLAIVSCYSLNLLRPENTAKRRCRSLVFSVHLNYNVIKVYYGILPIEAKLKPPTPALSLLSWEHTCNTLSLSPPITLSSFLREPTEISCEWDRLSFLFDAGFALNWCRNRYDISFPMRLFCQTLLQPTSPHTVTEMNTKQGKWTKYFDVEDGFVVEWSV